MHKLTEDGAYRRMLDWSWANGQPRRPEQVWLRMATNRFWRHFGWQATPWGSAVSGVKFGLWLVVVFLFAYSFTHWALVLWVLLRGQS